MTRHEKLLAEVLLREISGLKPQEIVQKLLETGLVNHRICEQMAIRSEVDRQQRLGMARCEALLAAADRFDCSYEKARAAFYNVYKS